MENGRTVSVHLDDLTDQTVAAYADNVEHIRFTHPLRHDQRAGYLEDLSFYHI